MPRKIVYLTAPVIVLGIAGLWLYGRTYAAPSVEVVNPVRGRAVQAVYATGTVEPGVMVPISPKGTARLTRLLAFEGEQVEKGQLLAQLEDTDLKESLVELEARKALAQKELERRQSLKKRGFATQESLDQAVTELDTVRANIAKVRAQLEYLQLLAPEDGTIIRRDGEIGEVISSGQPVFWMSCCKPLRVSADVDEEDIPLVRPGQKVLLGADAFPGEIFRGSVTSITPKGDPVARSYRVRIALDNINSLMIGMTAEANIITEEKDDALLIPSSSVSGGRAWVVDKGSLVKKELVTGISSTESVEVVSGLTQDSQVVLRPGDGMREGQRVSASAVAWDGTQTGR